jgi:hypothetical protein
MIDMSKKRDGWMDEERWEGGRIERSRKNDNQAKTN